MGTWLSPSGMCMWGPLETRTFQDVPSSDLPPDSTSRIQGIHQFVGGDCNSPSMNTCLGSKASTDSSARTASLQVWILPSETCLSTVSQAVTYTGVPAAALCPSLTWRSMSPATLPLGALLLLSRVLPHLLSLLSLSKTEPPQRRRVPSAVSV